ncbi:MAG: DUF433 domain-containing protein [Fimbriimonadia bacterium]|nr:DUF433 domain-containing protein [Fimbriimonadia bacterium]
MRRIELDEEYLELIKGWQGLLGDISDKETLNALFKAFLSAFRPAGQSETADLQIKYQEKEILLIFKNAEPISVIQSRPDVMGGDACIRNTRIPVWTLIDYKRQGLTDSQLLMAFPVLNASDLITAWDYYAAHSQEVDEQKRRHEEAA